MVIIHSFVRSFVRPCMHSFKHGFVHPSIAWGVNVSTKKIPVIKQRPTEDVLRRIPGGEGEDGQDALEVAAGEVCHVSKKKTDVFWRWGLPMGQPWVMSTLLGVFWEKSKLCCYSILLKEPCIGFVSFDDGNTAQAHCFVHRYLVLGLDKCLFLWSVSRWICWWDSNLNSSGVHGLHLRRGLVNVLTAGRTCDTMHWKVVWTCFLTQDNKEQQNLKILEMARMWKKRKLESSQ